MNGGRLVNGRVEITGVDDEWPGSDEVSGMRWEEFTFGVLDWTGSAEDRVGPLSVELRWGGECRVEVDLWAAVITDGGTVELTGEARLYEGDSEDTRDLEQALPILLTVLKGRPAHLDVRLESQGIGGGDNATVSLNFTNSAYENPDE